MRSNDLIRVVWTGLALEPDGNFAMHQLHDRLGAGEVINVDLDPDRSEKSHKHQFAFVRTAWQTLPDELKTMPYAKNADTLRKHALIETGFCDTEMLPVGCPRRAERVATSLSRVAVRLHGYAVTNIEGTVVYCHTPHSQSQRAMGAAAFQDSKQAVLEWLAGLIGVTPDQLANAGRSEAA
jgi:hypothetical protein